jgi:hypothetical protein
MVKEDLDLRKGRKRKNHLALGDGVVDVDGGEEEGAGLLHLVEPLDSGSGLLRDSNEPVLHLAVLLGVSLEPVADDGEHDLELGVVGGLRVGDLAGLLVLLLGLDALVDEERGVATVVDDEVGAAALAPVEAALGAPPVLLERLPLPGEDRGGVPRDGGGGVVLRGEDVAGAPADLGAKGGEGLDEDGGLDGHVEGARDPGAGEGLGRAELSAARHEPGHLDLGQLDLEAAEVGLGQVLDLVLPPRRGLLHGERHCSGRESSADWIWE